MLGVDGYLKSVDILEEEKTHYIRLGGWKGFSLDFYASYY